MARAGCKTVFLGIENASKKNLQTARKGDIRDATVQAIANCHKYGIMVLGGMIFGFPDDDEADIIANYEFLNTVKADTAYCQILTPYPKTAMRRQLMDDGLVTNPEDFTRYNGMWANVRTRHLSADELQYLFWYHRHNVMGWWEPSERVQNQGRLWTSIWLLAFKPLFKKLFRRQLRKYGWRGLFERDMAHQAQINHFPDLEGL